jgi:16S rRNA (adenine(1408)-N(1))-methyltransferase
VEIAAAFRVVAVDFGTGDGAFVQRLARERPEALVIGVDANAAPLREAAARVGRKPARGGLANARFGLLTLEQAPEALAGLADQLTVLLPWGALLRAVAGAEAPALAGLRGICKPGARVRLVFGHGPADAAALAALGLALPPVGAPAADAAAFARDLAGGYRDAGFEVGARILPLAEVRALPTTWAKKLAFSGHARVFWELVGRAR